MDRFVRFWKSNHNNNFVANQNRKFKTLIQIYR